MEDHLAYVFLVIVIAFFICHLPRIILSIHEMWTVNITIKCAQRGHWSFPIWALIMSQFSHLLLVINSSINCLIYCLLSSRFRKIVAQYAKKWGCYKPSPPSSIETPPEVAQPLNENNDEEVNILGVPTVSWILTADSQKLSFSTLMKIPFLIFDQTNPLNALALPS